jgi:hypothetical protein
MSFEEIKICNRFAYESSFIPEVKKKKMEKYLA